MPYLPLDLDGRKRIPHVARAIGSTPEVILWGLSSAWEEVWLSKRDWVTTGQLRGFFGCDGVAVGKALEDFGFVEDLRVGYEDRWRIRGAAKWLGVVIDKATAGSLGGKATAASRKSLRNLRHQKVEAATKPVEAASKQVLRTLEAPVEAKDEALTPNTQHPTPKEEETTTLSDSSNPTVLVFEHWREKLNHPSAKLDKKRRKAIGVALALGYTTAQLLAAIDGCAVTPHNIGQNDRGERYDQLGLILRDADHIDRFIHNAGSRPTLKANGRMRPDEEYHSEEVAAWAKES